MQMDADREKAGSMTNEYIRQIAMEQSAVDFNCRISDFRLSEHVVVPFTLRKNAKRYYELPIGCNFISYGNNIVVSTIDDLREIVETYIHKFTYYHCFETPNLHWLNERLLEKGYKVCFMAEYYLPDLRLLPDPECPYPTKVLEKADFGPLYLPEWSNALSEQRRELDVLGVGAYDGERLVGFAACSADADQMWQIGVDVLPEYRRRGIASALTSSLAREIRKHGKVPFYCTAWSNIRSVGNAIRSGFIPAWIEMTAKPAQVVDDMNR